MVASHVCVEDEEFISRRRGGLDLTDPIEDLSEFDEDFQLFVEAMDLLDPEEDDEDDDDDDEFDDDDELDEDEDL